MVALTSSRRRTRDPEAGQELIEFALVFPMLLLVMLGIIDFGFLFRNYEVLTNAAREGARVAVLPGYSASDVQTRVDQYIVASGLTGTATTTVGATQNINVGGSCIAVQPITVTYPHTYLFLGPIVGLLGGGSFTNKTLTATSTMRSETAASACP